MNEPINVYCDESCHLEHDGQRTMVLGAVWCPAQKVPEIGERIREIKTRHDVPSSFEAKWSKVSPAKAELYRDLLDYFFDDDDLHFRALVAEKEGLRHEDFGQDHDAWYYKMYFTMLKQILTPTNQYRIYLDIKDTRSADKARKLQDVLCTNIYDFDRSIIQRVQHVRSHEIEVMQLTDLLSGAVNYVNRGLNGNAGKQELVSRVRKRSGYNLTASTLPSAAKFNLFQWRPQVRE